MNRLASAAALVLLSTLFACGPAGKISGKVVVEGGTSGGILVRVLGPTSVGVVTDDSGAFSAAALPDGSYVVVADVAGTDEGSQRATVKVASGKADKDPTLSFKASVGKLAGKVVFADGVDSAGLTVVLSGTDHRGVQTGSGGAFEFNNLPAGAYLVSAEVPDSREGRQSVSVLVSGGTPVTLPDLTFTFAGTLTGNVKAGAVNAPGAVVEIPGTDLRTVTDASGNFTLDDVGTGMVTVQARLNAAVASQQVTVVRGANTALAFTLQTALAGTVVGSIGFHGIGIDTGITVSALGTTFTTTAAANGDYSLTLPPGDWTIAATARNFPRNDLGLVHVDPGATVRVPTARMSVFRRLPMGGTVNNAAINSARHACDGDLLFAAVDVGGVNQHHLVDPVTLNRRLVAVGTLALSELSPKCGWVAFGSSATTILHSVTTGEQRILSTLGSPSALEFSSDDSVLFFAIGNTLHRYTIATGTDDTFPANSRLMVSRDRWLVSANTVAPFNYQLVTPTGATQAFGNATLVETFAGAAWALTDCAASLCLLKTLGTQGTTISTASGQVAQGTALDANPNSPGEWYTVRVTLTGVTTLVRTSTAALVSLPVNTFFVRFNGALTRVAYISNLGGGGQALREEAVPPSGAATPAANTSGVFTNAFGYLSDARFMAFDSATPRRVDIKTGTATLDTDVIAPGTAGYTILGPVATWGKQSTTKRIATLGDGADMVLGSAPANLLTVAYATPNLGVTAGQAKYGSVCVDFSTFYVIDNVKNEARKLTAAIPTGGGFGGFMVALRFFSSEAALFSPAFDQFIPVTETGTTNDSSGVQVGRAFVMAGHETAGSRDLLLARFEQQP